MKSISIFLLIFCSIYSYGQNDPENKPSKTTSRKPLTEGPNVWGTFDGRVPCQEMTKAMQIKAEANCETLKWSFTFFQDPQSHQPSTYVWFGSLYREKSREGKWRLIKGTATNPDLTVIQIDPDKPDETFYLLKGDDNVLFVLDKNKKLMTGGDYLSYTFNRTVN